MRCYNWLSRGSSLERVILPKQEDKNHQDKNTTQIISFKPDKPQIPVRTFQLFSFPN